MSDTHITDQVQGQVPDQDTSARGRHRGVIRAEDVEVAPSGRHRKPSGQAAPAESAA
ncbi:hypothetical protein GCM10010145_38550 [Streptomyces ruber]|uniref:Uncharacterized protein n=2 Tax=Streptomyces TaxID=1883 RepID=A0A918BFE3_9ACTN|nr:hypothetical protein [Streptomyces ruber]GGQ64983.1 hypothetical protein GCM10010145_38550 [Streptomyces ruber]